MSYNPFGNQYQIGASNPVTSNNPLGSSQINTNIASTASTTTTASGVDKNDSSGLNSLLNLATQGAQIAGSIRYQRQQSGASANRQTRIAQCGRKPWFGKAKKEAYQKCLDDANKPLPSDVNGGNDNKNLGVTRGSSMKFVWIGLAVVALGGIGYILYKKSK
jgi:hypothetical protein